MNNQFKRAVVWMLSLCGVLGVSRSNAQDSVADSNQSLGILLRDGFVLPTKVSNLYQINQPAIRSVVNDDTIAREQIANLLAHLKNAFGPNVNIGQIEPINAVFGTQDMK